MTTFTLQVTLEGGDLSDYEIQQRFLEKLPEWFTRSVQLLDARITVGLVDEEDVPIRMQNH